MSARALAAALLNEGGTEAALVDPDVPVGSGGPAALAASGPRAAADPGEYELLVEEILEGSLLHYETQRVVRTDDPDLALLVGDHLYARGLSRRAARGDLESVVALADVIAAVARAHAEGTPEATAAAWELGARRVGWGAEA
jgi:hypothetical protein